MAHGVEVSVQRKRRNSEEMWQNGALSDRSAGVTPVWYGHHGRGHRASSHAMAVGH